MHEHGPNPLDGPVRGTSAWWHSAHAEDISKNILWVESHDSDHEIRVDLVARVRKEIAAGTYDTPERWQAALDLMLDRLDD